MHEEPLDKNPDLQLEALERRLTLALEAAPEVRIPADFAARVVGKVPASLPLRRNAMLTPTRYGPAMLRIGIVVLFVALLGFALRAGPHSSVGVAIEWVLFAQFIGLTTWLSLRSHRSAD